MSVVDTKFELFHNVEHVLDIGRDFQNQDRFHGAHYDTVKLLCDTIEYLRDKLPKPDPDWKAICEKCHDGDIEPDCEYYGEPNGCNSPIYGEHPKAKPVGNAAAMRDALKELRDIVHDAFWSKKGTVKGDVLNALRRANVALAKPPRNCDLFSIYSEAEDYWHENVECADVNGCFDVWLFEPAKQKGECDGSK